MSLRVNEFIFNEINFLMNVRFIVSVYSTDTFSVKGNSGSGQNSPPTICGTNTNEHSKFKSIQVKTKALRYYSRIIPFKIILSFPFF